MFCKTCDCLVCPLCISKTHNGHGLVTIGEGYDINIDILKTNQKNISTKIEELKKRKAELKYVNKAEQFKYKNTIKNMELQRTELKKNVDKHIDKLKSEIMKRWRALRQSINKEECEMTLLIRSMKSKNSEVDEIIKSENAESVFGDGLGSINVITRKQT
ncbi:TRIM46 [Mytilus edulis]|uniref:TRIM46 n=1 Tax=Mytilus edulis TaxID=6550 RepID=A0A8S3UL23_MYTED|nr:TRIM46 [Mytilus edulis]